MGWRDHSGGHAAPVGQGQVGCRSGPRRRVRLRGGAPARRPGGAGRRRDRRCEEGTGTVGVQGQYPGTAGRIENSQVAVYLVYAGKRGHADEVPLLHLGDVARHGHLYRLVAAHRSVEGGLAVEGARGAGQGCRGPARARPAGPGSRCGPRRARPGCLPRSALTSTRGSTRTPSRPRGRGRVAGPGCSWSRGRGWWRGSGRPRRSRPNRCCCSSISARRRLPRRSRRRHCCCARLEPGQFTGAHSAPRIRCNRLTESSEVRACERILAYRFWRTLTSFGSEMSRPPRWPSL